MARIYSGAITLLRHLYSLAAGVSLPQEVDTDSPIQFVHDVSREAELSFGRYIIRTVAQAHGGAGDIRTSVDLSDDLTVTEVERQVDAYFLRASPKATTPNNIARWGVGMVITSAVQPGMLAAEFLLATGSVNVQVELTGGGPSELGYNSNSMVPPFPNPFPIFLAPESCVITVFSQATGAAQMDCDLLFWVGPRGTLPPGL